MVIYINHLKIQHNIIYIYIYILGTSLSGQTFGADWALYMFNIQYYKERFFIIHTITIYTKALSCLPFALLSSTFWIYKHQQRVDAWNWNNLPKYSRHIVKIQLTGHHICNRDPGLGYITQSNVCILNHRLLNIMMINCCSHSWYL